MISSPLDNRCKEKIVHEDHSIDRKIFRVHPGHTSLSYDKTEFRIV